jgi:hypothetical protein
VPTKPGSQIGIPGDGFVRKMSAGQHHMIGIPSPVQTR